MTDEELIESLRAVCTCNIDSTPCMAEDDCRDALAAADRIEALVKARREDALELLAAHGQAQDAYEAQLKAEARAERLEEALRVARVHVANNAEGWSVSRGAARNDLTIVDAALKGADHE